METIAVKCSVATGQENRRSMKLDRKKISTETRVMTTVLTIRSLLFFRFTKDTALLRNVIFLFYTEIFVKVCTKIKIIPTVPDNLLPLLF